MVLEYFLKRTERAKEIKGWCSALKSNPSYPGTVQGELSRKMGEKDISGRGKMDLQRWGRVKEKEGRRRRELGKSWGVQGGTKKKETLPSSV